MKCDSYIILTSQGLDDDCIIECGLEAGHYGNHIYNGTSDRGFDGDAEEKKFTVFWE